MSPVDDTHINNYSESIDVASRGLDIVTSCEWDGPAVIFIMLYIYIYYDEQYYHTVDHEVYNLSIVVGQKVIN